MVCDYEIVPARLEMLAEILEIEEACFSVPWTSKMMEAELNGNPFAYFLVALRHDKAGSPMARVAGYHCFWIVFEELRVMKLAVRESLRRRGIGRALAMTALGLGLAQGASRAVLEVRRSNEAAQSFYRSMGFVPMSLRRQYYSNPIEDAVVMEMAPLVIPSELGRGSIVAGRKGSVSAHDDNPGGVPC